MRNNGTLVTMETKAKWDFVNNYIKQNILSTYKYEWNIGLYKDDGIWKWVNGKQLDWDGTKGEWPWHSGEPSQVQNKDVYANIWIKTLALDYRCVDVSATNTKPYICEYTVSKYSFF